MHKSLPIELLRTFSTVVDERGFTRAAQVLGMSQPAVSLHLKRLEGLVGSELLNRRGRALAPTGPGEALLDYARQMIRLNDEALAVVSRSPLSGHVRLGIPNEFASSYLPRVLGRFAKEHPSLTLEVNCDLSTHLLGRLAHRDLDLAVAIHAGAVDESLVHWREDLAWVAAQDYVPDASRPLPLVVAPSGCVYRDRMLNTLRLRGTACRIVYTGTSYNGIRAAVGAGLGVTVLARSTVPPDLKILGRGSALPALEPARVAIHYDADQLSSESRILVDYIQSAHRG